jgi:Type II CAAX prenyl endopeptidase Rce1-like
MVVLQQFGILLGLSSLGIIVALIQAIPIAQLQLSTMANAAELPPLWVIIFLQVLQEVGLLSIAIFVGIFCTRSIGLHSHTIDYFVFNQPLSTSIIPELKVSLGLGAIVTIIVLIIDQLIQPFLPTALQAVNSGKPSWLGSLAGILHGGINEEILIRWGLMSLLIWGGWKLSKWGIALPATSIYQIAIVGAAIIFGLLHLPITATITSLTPIVITRALLLNGIAGVACGWLFWQYSLEAAILAHASFHALLFVVNMLTFKSS